MKRPSQPGPTPSTGSKLLRGRGGSPSSSDSRRKRRVRQAVRDHRASLSDDALQAQYNADKFLQREGWTRPTLERKLMCPLVGSSSLREAVPAQTHESAWQEIRRLKTLLLLGKESEAYAAALALAKEFEGNQSLEARRIVARCTEIARDSGQFGNPLVASARIAVLGIRVTESWILQREYLEASFSLLTLVNLIRINAQLLGEKSVRRAMRLTDGAEYILEGKCRNANRVRVAALRHQAIWLRLALTAFEARQPEDARHLVRRLGELATEIGTRAAYLKTAKEETDYYTAMGEFDKAEEGLAQFKRLAGNHFEHEPLVQLGIWRPEIELKLALGRRLEAQELLVKYVDLFIRHPYWQHASHLRRFETQYGLCLPAPRVETLQNAFLIYPHLEGTSEDGED